MSSIDVSNVSLDSLNISEVIMGSVTGFVCLCILYVIINSGKFFHKTNNSKAINLFDYP